MGAASIPFVYPLWSEQRGAVFHDHRISLLVQAVEQPCTAYRMVQALSFSRVSIVAPLHGIRALSVADLLVQR